MKLRIQGNSLRLRLTKTEVKTFCETGKFEQQTIFLENTLTYRLVKGIHQDIKASFIDNSMIISISETLAQDWDENERIGFEHLQELTNGETLFLLIEKDFVCLDETVEDQSDNYTNPKSLNL